jgi:16S rRNA (guanine527-N7)-methyltransferase
MPSILRRRAAQFNLSLTEFQLRAFQIYNRELIAWNQRVNLTRIVEPEEITVKHFLDSLSVYQALPDLPQNFSIIDVGTGAGFPTKFLQHIVDTLQLNGVTVLAARAEDVGRQAAHREQYDVALARAVASLPVLAEYTLPVVRVEGLVIAQKGQHLAEEVEAAIRVSEMLGGQLDRILPVEVPGLEAARHLIIIRKSKATPKQYPRRPGVPAKRPL